MTITNPVTFKIIIGLFNAAPGKSYLTDIENLAKGKTLAQLADALAATTIFTSVIMGDKDTTALKVAVLMHNFGVVADSNPTSVGSQAQAFFTNRIDAGVGFGAIVYEAVNFLSQDSATLPAAFTTVATLLSNKAAVAMAYSATNASTDLAKLQSVLSAVTGTELYTDVQVAAILAASGSTTADSTITGSVNADILAGGSGNDTLSGLAGDDIINGGAGDDIIYGGTGADIMTGGAGADTFVFDATVGANSTGITSGDVITDFTVDTDKLFFDGVTAVASAQQTAVQAAVTALADATTTQIAAVMAATNKTSLGVSFAVYGGDTYVYYQTTGGAAASAADDVFIKLTGVASGFTFGTTVVDKLPPPPPPPPLATTINLTEFDDTYSTPGDGNFIINGLGGNDIITTGSGNDSINGGSGNDTIAAQAGADIITGGAGNDSIALGVDSDMDTVIFGATAGGNGNDIITNFISGTDKLNVGAITASSTVTAVTGALTITYNKLYFLDSGIAGNADSAAAVAAALNAGATWTSTPNTVSYFLINDDNSSSIWSYVGTNTPAVAVSDLILMGTIDAEVTTGDLLFA
ncbi:MAG: calcium-binding protein [Bacteroidetes bacterium]|nr:calcium-binding protein [Bacteroidota bacterium]